MKFNDTIENINSKRTALRAIICDVDGVLTNGQIAYTDTGKQVHHYHALDGYGFIHLVQRGFLITIVSGRDNPSAIIRGNELGVTEVHTAITSKITLMKQLSQKYQIPLKNWGAIGDDINDLECFQASGLSFTVPQAHPKALEAANIITSRHGGAGAFREISDWILGL
ncbi:MAG: phenylphosphate carboxylase subunit delta [Gammaproteobacteria bacterium]|jgi:3-deoxy-D-manno-octulosonate 8-phosphate phosphatase (KDO 8-P phosphatase)|nr:phenylphosphate carboxylase subunit delta [Gammaproteobacteria bacterium]